MQRKKRKVGTEIADLRQLLDTCTQERPKPTIMDSTVWRKLPLGKKSDEQVAKMLSELTGGEPVSPRLVKRVRKHRRITMSPLSLLDQITYDTIGRRIPKTVRQVHAEVSSVYGTVHMRAIYRSLVRLLDERKIVCIAGSTSEHRKPLHERITRKQQIAPGAYVRMDSPLVWDHRERYTLIELVDNALVDGTTFF